MEIHIFNMNNTLVYAPQVKPVNKWLFFANRLQTQVYTISYMYNCILV